MSDRFQRTIVTATIAVLSVMVMAGSIYGWLEGKELPQWLVVLVGSIGTGAFLTSGFFVLEARATAAMASLDQSRANHHELAMAVANRAPSLQATEVAHTSTAEEAAA